MSQLRIALPPLAELTLDSPLGIVWIDRQGQCEREEQGSLLQLGQTAKVPAVVCFLHPEDSLLASIELPLLPAAKTAAAVACAAQNLMLGNSEQMQVVHGPRDAGGQVQISWLARDRLEHLGQLLGQAQLKLRGLYPAPYALPLKVEGQPSGCLADGQLLLRQSLQQATVQPLVGESLDDLHASGVALHWIGDDAPATCISQRPASQRWSGELPGWGLHTVMQQRGRPARGWGKALACCGLALLVWTLGLNLYAAHLADQGQRLKTQMSERVRQVFPELPVILNPLQQARQQLTARQNTSAADPGQRFTSLLQQAGITMPFMVGSVQALNFANGQLQVSLLADSHRPSSDNDWQAALGTAGFEAIASPDGWTLRPGSGAAVTETDADSNDEADDDDDE